MDRGAWWASVHVITKSRTQLRGWTQKSFLLSSGLQFFWDHLVLWLSFWTESLPNRIQPASLPCCCCYSVANSCLTLQPHGLQHARLPCLSPTSRACSNSCPSRQWCHPTISSCFPLLLLPSIFPSIRVFSNESILRIRWPKYWSFSFSISPSNEYSGLISFRIDYFDLLARVFFSTTVEKYQFFRAQPSLWSNSHICTWLLEKPYSFDYMDLCQPLFLWTPHLAHRKTKFHVFLPQTLEVHTSHHAALCLHSA